MLVLLLGLLWFEYGYRQPADQIERALEPFPPEVVSQPKQIVAKDKVQSSLPFDSSKRDGRQCIPRQQELPQGQQYQLNHSPSFYEAEFGFRLHERVKQVIDLYSVFLRGEQLPAFIFNIRFFSVDDFEQFLTENGYAGASYQGLYYPGSNVSFVKVSNEKQALNTATHEMVHAINRHLFGRAQIPRFLNEGLAEYFEHYSFENEQQSGLNSSVANYWSQLSVQDELLDFYTLIHSEQDWHTSNNLSLYYSGALWTHFLLSQKNGMNAVSELLATMIKEPCKAILPDDIITVFMHHYPDFEQEFYYFFEELINASRAKQIN